MSWSKVKLGEVSVSIQPGPFGSQLHSSDYSDVGTPIVMPKDMIDGRIVHGNLERVPEEHVKRLSRHQVCEGNLMVARKGDVRKCVYITEKERGWLTGSDCLKVSLNEKRCFPKFIYYQLRSPFIGRWLETISIGATMPSINTGLLSSIELHLPDIATQKHIADILSAYDNLIENNQKQIKLLEEAAQRLYKEWFIDLRFPGHETTKIHNGLPEGWTKVLISEVCDTIGGGTPSTKVSDYYDNGNIPWVTPTDITRNNGWILLDTEKKITQKGLENSSAKMLPAETILMTSRASIGYFGMYDFPVSTNQGFISCVPYKKEFKYYLLFNLMNRVDEIKQKATGSTFLEIGKTTFRNFEIIYPTKGLLVEFDRMIDSIIKRMRIIKKEIADLAQARDRLLPKLMSGEIEV